MTGWTCPECGRLFARARQGHDCAPGLTLDEALCELLTEAYDLVAPDDHRE